MEENKMGVLPVKKLIVSMAVPMMISRKCRLMMTYRSNQILISFYRKASNF